MSNFIFSERFLFLCLISASFLSTDISAQINNTESGSGEILFLDDPCGSNKDYAFEMLRTLGEGWGYNYDSLTHDLESWRLSEFVRIDTAGFSVQGRVIWELSITDDAGVEEKLFRVAIHARTHPSEVQSTYVTNEIIKLLTGDSETARILREKCVFNIFPMYNPDGVEIGAPRENANGLDLERNWDQDPHQPETAALKGRFEEYMAGENPIDIALNMHSAFACKRYFVFHHKNGTSANFESYEKNFISSIRQYWIDGIEDWNYYVSWASGTPPYYPESWFWMNFGEEVMSLTYEDMNCVEAGEYRRTAEAILEGITDYLSLRPLTSVRENADLLKNSPQNLTLSLYPNPSSVGSKLTINFSINEPRNLDISVYNVLGEITLPVTTGHFEKGSYNFSLPSNKLANGIYFVRLESSKGIKTFPFAILK